MQSVLDSLWFQGAVLCVTDGLSWEVFQGRFQASSLVPLVRMVSELRLFAG